MRHADFRLWPPDLGGAKFLFFPPICDARYRPQDSRAAGRGRVGRPGGADLRTSSRPRSPRPGFLGPRHRGAGPRGPRGLGSLRDVHGALRGSAPAPSLPPSLHGWGLPLPSSPQPVSSGTRTDPLVRGGLGAGEDPRVETGRLGDDGVARSEPEVTVGWGNTAIISWTLAA